MFFCTGVDREKKEGIKRTIKNTCWNFSVTQGLTVMFTSSKELEQRKNRMFLWHVRRSPIAKKYMNQKVKQEV